MFDVIERLKSEWTDKYVVVDAAAPELARFAQTTGLVKTVNMNGRCLVEFDQYNNTGWYDIDPSFLKIVPKPLPKPPEAKPAKEAPKAAAKPAAPAKPAAKESAAKPAAAAGGKRPSTAEILAAARAGKSATAPPPAKPAPPPEPAEVPGDAVEEVVAEEAPVAEKPATKKPAAKGSLPTTTAEKIAWCRANDAGKG